MGAIKLIPFAHPWNKWFSQGARALKGTFTLKQGKDFRCEPHSMAQQVRTAASKRGLKVSLSLRDKTLKVEFSKNIEVIQASKKKRKAHV